MLPASLLRSIGCGPAGVVVVGVEVVGVDVVGVGVVGVELVGVGVVGVELVGVWTGVTGEPCVVDDLGEWTLGSVLGLLVVVGVDAVGVEVVGACVVAGGTTWAWAGGAAAGGVEAVCLGELSLLSAA
jgi:hypothetical protein